MSDPATVLLWTQAFMGVASLVEALADMTRRMQAGETVTKEELGALRAETKAAVARWDAAAKETEDA